MALVRNFLASTSLPNQVALSWNQPLGFNDVDSEIIVTRTITHYPMELFNQAFPTKATDSRPVEIFRGKTIVGLVTATISVTGTTLTDTAASFPTNPKLTGRLLRDKEGSVFSIISNTATTVTLSGTPANGKYVILVEYPTVIRAQQNFENDIRTTTGPGFIQNLVELINGSLLVQTFTEGELANSIFKDANGIPFVIRNNTNSTLYFYEKYNFSNASFVPFTYTTLTGVIQFASAVNLSSVVAGNLFVDSLGVKYPIISVNDGLDQLVIATGQTVGVATPTDYKQGSVVLNEVPVIGTGMGILTNFKNGTVIPFIDTYKNDSEALARTGTGLLDNQFYYYTSFTKPTATNVAQAEFAVIDSGVATQSSAISTKNRDFGKVLYNYWPSLYRELDVTEDLQDLMEVFAFQFGEIHAIIDTYRLQDTHTVFATALAALADQTGLPSVGYAIGVDTLRRIAADMIRAWHLKGSKEGIALFIKILTTWDITGGTGDSNSSIIDFLPNVAALRFFDANLGSTNTRLTQSSPFVSGGRFAKSLPGIVIPGFFTFREFVVDIPSVALFVGSTTNFTVSSGTTIVSDGSANFGATNSLVGNFLLPNQQEINDIFQIIANTSTSITVRGVVENKNIGGEYAILSPLNANRFIIMTKLMSQYAPFGTKPGYKFT